jgi:hypothetical protein
MSEETNTYPKFAFDASKIIIYGGGGLSKMIIESVGYWMLPDRRYHR